MYKRTRRSMQYPRYRHINTAEMAFNILIPFAPGVIRSAGLSCTAPPSVFLIALDMINLRYTFKLAEKVGGQVSLPVTPLLPHWLCVVSRLHVAMCKRNFGYECWVPDLKQTDLSCYNVAFFPFVLLFNRKRTPQNQTFPRVSSVLLPAYTQAVRNCPWVVKIWSSYTRSQERVCSNHQEIVGGGHFQVEHEDLC